MLALAFICTIAALHDYPRASSVQQKSAQRKSPPIVYVALGDSTGTGVGAKQGGYVERLFKRIEDARTGSRLVNLCTSGAATANVLDNQIERVVNARPTLVTVGVGANDLIRGVSAEEFARNYETLVARLIRSTGAFIILMNIPDISLAPAVPEYMRGHARRHVRAFNERIKEVASRHNLLVVDLYSRSQKFSSHPDFFSEDGIHPSDAGYEFWAELVWPYMGEAIGKR